MQEIKTIEEVHSILLDIVVSFHDVCKRNNIPYYLVYGSMLGAVRHKGFIPWDDDIDVAIEHKYYNVLLNALRADLPSKYRVLTRYDKNGPVGGYLKIEDSTTLICESCRKSTERSGLFLDIFSLYPATGNTSLFSKYSLIKILRFIQVSKYFRHSHSKLPMRILQICISITFFWIKRYYVINFIEKFLIPQKGSYLCTYATIYNKKDIIPKEVYGTPKEYAFEDKTLMGVQDYEDYLSAIYGDYMTLPCKENRRVHLQKVYKNII